MPVVTIETLKGYFENGLVPNEDHYIDVFDTMESLGGGAPVDASYVTLGLDDDLSAERVATEGNGISITDGTTIVTFGLTTLTSGWDAGNSFGIKAKNFVVPTGNIVGTTATNWTFDDVALSITSSVGWVEIGSPIQGTLSLKDTDYTLDEKWYTIQNLNGKLSGLLFNDAGSSWNTWFSVDRTGYVVDSVIFYTGSSSPALTLDSSQDATFAGDILASDGTVNDPSIAFSSDPTTGFYYVSSGRMALTLDATKHFEFRDDATYKWTIASGKTFTGSMSSIAFGVSVGSMYGVHGIDDANNRYYIEAWLSGTGNDYDIILNAAGGNVGVGKVPATKLDVDGNIIGVVLESTQTTGTAPFTIASATVVANLNVDQVDGYDAADFSLSGHTHIAYLNKDGSVALTANWDAGAFEIRAATLVADGLTAGRVVYTTTNGELADSSNLTWSGSILAVGGLGAQVTAANFYVPTGGNVGTTSYYFDFAASGIARLVGTALNIESSATTSIILSDTGSGSNQKIFSFTNNDSTLYGYLWSDDLLSVNSWVSVDRTGYSVDNVKFYTGASVEAIDINSSQAVTFSGSVGIGGAPTAKFIVIGDTDEIQSIFRANVTQTANIVEYQKSTGTVYGGVDPIGRLGVGSAPNANTFVNVSPSGGVSSLAGSEGFGINCSPSWAPDDSNRAKPYTGVNSDVKAYDINATGTLESAVGGRFRAQSRNTTQAISSLIGGDFRTYNYSSGTYGNVTLSIAGKFSSVMNGGTWTDHYGAYIAEPTGAGTLTNNYGLYIEGAAKGATLNYAIYTNAGAVRFGDAVESTATITGTQLISNIAIGTAPLVITSTTLVTNLNADRLDSQEGSYYTTGANVTGVVLQDGSRALTANWDAGAFEIRAATLVADGLTSGRVVLATTNGELTDNAGLTFSGTSLFLQPTGSLYGVHFTDGDVDAAYGYTGLILKPGGIGAATYHETFKVFLEPYNATATYRSSGIALRDRGDTNNDQYGGIVGNPSALYIDFGNKSGYTHNLNFRSGSGFTRVVQFRSGGGIDMTETTAEPADPATGKCVFWMSNGTGYGDDGDFCMKINPAGTVKSTTIVDFSTL